ncbi:LOW QUALITY PROTEIN: speriolin [Talpa occidentalis]|uniref:LOW QUALITY PROTEIN: speriolin n=1 Tax=Talpa occidentalis TaxID=50954 RepID=UPI00188E2E28|nr:LOW QUALITY PROTEIN: speriolin [Talpa occidentalis]
MSLLTNYEGLRQQIERLVRENEELKKLVRLIRENHELRSAIKTQAAGLGISGFSGRLGEAGSGSAPCQGVFLSPSLATAGESVLEEMGVVALAPLAEMLNSSQSSPLTGPLNTLLSSPGPMSQSTQLTSLLTGPLGSRLTSPIAVTPVGTLPSSLGLPSTGSLTPSGPLAAPLAMSQGGPLTSSLGLPSTGPMLPSGPLVDPLTMPQGGPLTSSLGQPSTGPLMTSGPLVDPLAMSQGNPLMAPMTSPMALSLGSPLFTSTPASLGVSQNLLANPMSNLVASETQGVRLAEPPQGAPAAPHPSTCTVPATTSKAPVTTEYPQPTQDPEPLNVTFGGAPIQPSSSISAAGTAGPTPAFYGTSDACTQPGAPQGPAVPASVPASQTGSPAVPPPLLPPPRLPQPHTSCPPSSTTQVAQDTHQAPAQAHHSPTRPPPSSRSPPRNPHSPPRAPSSAAAVQGTRAPRGPDVARKSTPDPERKLTHRKTCKFPDGAREPKQPAWERLVGEIAFQLDRRILSSIFPERVRLYGFTVSNIPEKIIQASLNPHDHKLDEDLCQTLTQRYVGIMNRLQSLGYNGRVHPALTEQLVNAYGILRERPELAASEGGSYTVDFLQRVLVETVHPSVLTDALLLLSCLSQLARDDGKPMFIW